MIPWLLDGEHMVEIPEDAVGFIYMITFGNGDYYIGKRNFYSTRRTKVKGKLRRKVVTKESDWKKYNSSSTEVKERIAEGEKYKKEVMHLCSSKACLMYLEIKEQIVHNVLCDPKSINKNIMLKLFKCIEPMKRN